MISPTHSLGDTQHAVTQNDGVIERISAGTATRADRDFLASLLLQAVHDSLYLDDCGRPMRPEAARRHGAKKAGAERAWLTGPVAGLYLLHLDIDPDAALSRLRRKWEDSDRFAGCDTVMH